MDISSNSQVDEFELCCPCDIWQANITSKDRYPNLEVALSRKVDSSYETIEMRACVKEEKVPLDYWTFVQGNPRGFHKNIRPLLPCEVRLFFDLSHVEGKTHRDWVVVDKHIPTDIWKRTKVDN